MHINNRICTVRSYNCLLNNDEALAQVDSWFVPKHLTSKQDGVVHVWLIIRCGQVAGPEQVRPVKGRKVNEHARDEGAPLTSKNGATRFGVAATTCE